jgi:hypothetical protein
LFSLGTIPIDPTLSDDPQHEGWVIQGTLTKSLTNCNTVLFLFMGQKRCMFKSHKRIVCIVLYDTLTTAAMYLWFSQRPSCTSRRTVSTFLDVEPVEGRPDLLSSSSDVLSLLKCMCHSKHLAQLMASFFIRISFQKCPLQICRVSRRI